MDETRRKPTTGIKCPTLYDKWHGVFYMASGTHGHTKVCIYPVMGHWGKVKALRHIWRQPYLTSIDTIQNDSQY